MTNQTNIKENLLPLQTLIRAMRNELLARGCEQTHRLIVEAEKYDQWLSAVLDPGKEGTVTAAPKEPENKLHLMPLDDILVMDLSDFGHASLSHHTRHDLAEAAFRLENEMMNCLDDPEIIPFDLYTDMDSASLIRIIQTSVEKIVQLGRG